MVLCYAELKCATPATKNETQDIASFTYRVNIKKQETPATFVDISAMDATFLCRKLHSETKTHSSETETTNSESDYTLCPEKSGPLNKLL